MLRKLLDTLKMVTGHLRDAQTFDLMRMVGTELCFT